MAAADVSPAQPGGLAAHRKQRRRHRFRPYSQRHRGSTVATHARTLVRLLPCAKLSTQSAFGSKGTGTKVPVGGALRFHASRVPDESRRRYGNGRPASWASILGREHHLPWRRIDDRRLNRYQRTWRRDARHRSLGGSVRGHRLGVQDSVAGRRIGTCRRGCYARNATACFLETGRSAQPTSRAGSRS